MAKIDDAEVAVAQEIIETKILFVRGKKVMLDNDLAALYGVETKHLKRAVKRNLSRFPDDFMLELSVEEVERSRCQFGTLKRGQNIKFRPYAFTELGVTMLSSVLNSERAVQVNMQIMRTFVRLREMLATHEDLRRKIESLESRYDSQFEVVFDAIKQLLTPPETSKRTIGFHHE